MNPTPPNQPSRAAKLWDSLPLLNLDPVAMAQARIEGIAVIQSALDEERKEGEHRALMAASVLDNTRVADLARLASQVRELTERAALSASCNKERVEAFNETRLEVARLTEEKERLIRERVQLLDMVEQAHFHIREKRPESALMVLNNAQTLLASHPAQPTGQAGKDEKPRTLKSFIAAIRENAANPPRIGTFMFQPNGAPASFAVHDGFAHRKIAEQYGANSEMAKSAPSWDGVSYSVKGGMLKWIEARIAASPAPQEAEPAGSPNADSISREDYLSMYAPTEAAATPKWMREAAEEIVYEAMGPSAFSRFDPKEQAHFAAIIARHAPAAPAGSESEKQRADSERMDWLEGELARENARAAAGVHYAAQPMSLFRLNQPITRSAIDAARAARKEGV